MGILAWIFRRKKVDLRPVAEVDEQIVIIDTITRDGH